MKGIDFIRDRDAMAADLGEFDMSCNHQVYVFGMFLEIEIDFVHSPSTFGNCDSFDLRKVVVIGHYPGGDMGEAYRRGKYVPINLPVNIDELGEDEIEDIKGACAAHVEQCIKDARGY